MKILIGWFINTLKVGTVIEGPGEFYSARIPKKSRQSTIVDELLADDKFRRLVKSANSNSSSKLYSVSF